MRLTKYTHSCIRLAGRDGTIVLDPGVWSEPRALHGADAVFVSHEHSDHIDQLRLAGLGVPVYAPADARIEGVPVRPLTAGDTVTIAGWTVRAVGGRHATVYDGAPDCPNLGYLLSTPSGRAVYHPGDSLYVPPTRVSTLLVPVQGSWLKTSEAIDFVREVDPDVVIGIHEARLNDRGLAAVHGWFAEHCSGYRRLSVGESLALD